MELNKNCNMCNCALTTDNAVRNKSYADGYSKRCKTCHRMKSAEWKAADPDRAKASQRRTDAKRRGTEQRRRSTKNSNLVLRYGIDLETYELMYAAQRGFCATCGCEKDLLGGHIDDVLHVDHDHVTLEVRELLCLRCNTALKAGWDADHMRRMADYLDKHDNN